MLFPFACAYLAALSAAPPFPRPTLLAFWGAGGGMDTLGELKPNYGGLVKKKQRPSLRMPLLRTQLHFTTTIPDPGPYVGGDGSNWKIARHQMYDKKSRYCGTVVRL